MRIYVSNNTLIGGQWTGVGEGNFAPHIAEHLIRMGVATPLEVKTVEPAEKKLDRPSSASQADQVSAPKTAKSRGRRSIKRSSSTTPGE